MHGERKQTGAPDMATKVKLNTEDRDFFSRVSDAVFTNPFSDENEQFRGLFQIRAMSAVGRKPSWTSEGFASPVMAAFGVSGRELDRRLLIALPHPPVEAIRADR